LPGFSNVSGTQALLAILLPFLLAGCWLFSPLRCTAGRLAPLSPLPALMLALFGPEWQVDLPWMLLGTQLGLDATGRVFLALTAALWLAAGLHGKHHFTCDAPRPGFQLAWLLTLAGNLGLTVAQDMLSFLLCFTVMSVAAYPLIIHDRTPQSLYAGRIYLLLVVLGELLLFWAAVIAAGQTGAMTFSDLAPALAASPQRGLVTGLLLAGFGIKVGIMPLHGWLPLAHPAAPVAASAVLSGAMIKAGLLGWLRFLPLGSVQLSPWGEALITLGLLSALLAALLGMAQRKPKTVLAYSSVSQMGLASVTVGAGLLAPAAWPALRGALLLFIVSHGMAKAALFLGVGVAQARRETALQRAAAAAGLLLAAASIAGLPLTLGYIAKKSQATIAGWLPAF
jgi:formate hydrogenlyase subunit 3/multisubunit Na+/H+ antiporter MnhD subunit